MDSLAQSGCCIGANLDWEANEILDIQVEGCEIEEAPSGLNINEEVDVTVVVGVTTCYGSVYPDI